MRAKKERKQMKEMGDGRRKGSRRGRRGRRWNRGRRGGVERERVGEAEEGEVDTTSPGTYCGRDGGGR